MLSRMRMGGCVGSKLESVEVYLDKMQVFDLAEGTFWYLNMA